MANELPAPIFTPPRTVIRPGEHLITVKVYVFRCPLCFHEFRYDDPYEPMCTGPNWTDDHAPEVMRFHRIDTRREMV